MPTGLILGAVLGGLLGWEMGRWRSVWLRLTAQNALCLAEIEAHARPGRDAAAGEARLLPDVEVSRASTPRSAEASALSAPARTYEPVARPEPSAPLDPAATDLLEAARNFAVKGSTGARSQALAYYRAFVDHYPTDPRIDDVRETIRALQRELREAGEEV